MASINPLLDQQAPVIIRAVVLVRGAAFAREAGRGRAVRGRDKGEEVHFEEAGELAGGEFEGVAEGGEGREGEELGGWDEAAAWIFRWGKGRGGVDGYAGEGVGGGEAGVVAVVAEVIEGFVGVFDGDFGAGWVGEKEGCHRVVEVGAVAEGLVGWEDEELGDPFAAGERGGGEERWWGEGEVVDLAWLDGLWWT